MPGFIPAGYGFKRSAEESMQRVVQESNAPQQVVDITSLDSVPTINFNDTVEINNTVAENESPPRPRRILSIVDPASLSTELHNSNVLFESLADGRAKGDVSSLVFEDLTEHQDALPPLSISSDPPNILMRDDISSLVSDEEEIAGHGDALSPLSISSDPPSNNAPIDLEEEASGNEITSNSAHIGESQDSSEAKGDFQQKERQRNPLLLAQNDGLPVVEDFEATIAMPQPGEKNYVCLGNPLEAMPEGGVNGASTTASKLLVAFGTKERREKFAQESRGPLSHRYHLEMATTYVIRGGPLVANAAQKGRTFDARELENAVGKCVAIVEKQADGEQSVIRAIVTSYNAITRTSELRLLDTGERAIHEKPWWMQRMVKELVETRTTAIYPFKLFQCSRFDAAVMRSVSLFIESSQYPGPKTALWIRSPLTRLPDRPCGNSAKLYEVDVFLVPSRVWLSDIALRDGWAESDEQNPDSDENSCFILRGSPERPTPDMMAAYVHKQSGR